MSEERHNDEILSQIKVEISVTNERLESLNREITENIKTQLNKIEKYNREQNGHITKVIKTCASNETRGIMNTRLVIFAISLSAGLGIYAVSSFIH